MKKTIKIIISGLSITTGIIIILVLVSTVSLPSCSAKQTKLEKCMDTVASMQGSSIFGTPPPIDSAVLSKCDRYHREDLVNENQDKQLGPCEKRKRGQECLSKREKLKYIEGGSAAL